MSPGKRCDEIIRIIDELLCDQPRLAGASPGLMSGSAVSIAAGTAPREAPATRRTAGDQTCPGSDQR